MVSAYIDPYRDKNFIGKMAMDVAEIKKACTQCQEPLDVHESLSFRR